jgi:hypothetical protein
VAKASSKYNIANYFKRPRDLASLSTASPINAQTAGFWAFQPKLRMRLAVPLELVPHIKCPGVGGPLSDSTNSGLSCTTSFVSRKPLLYAWTAIAVEISLNV